MLSFFFTFCTSDGKFTEQSEGSLLSFILNLYIIYIRTSNYLLKLFENDENTEMWKTLKPHYINDNNSKIGCYVYCVVIPKMIPSSTDDKMYPSFIFISCDFIESQKRMHSLEQFLLCLCANVVCARIVNNWGCYPKKCLFSWNSFWKIHFVV